MNLRKRHLKSEAVAQSPDQVLVAPRPRNFVGEDDQSLEVTEGRELYLSHTERATISGAPSDNYTVYVVSGPGFGPLPNPPDDLYHRIARWGRRAAKTRRQRLVSYLAGFGLMWNTQPVVVLIERPVLWPQISKIFLVGIGEFVDQSGMRKFCKVYVSSPGCVNEHGEPYQMKEWFEAVREYHFKGGKNLFAARAVAIFREPIPKRKKPWWKRLLRR